MARLGKGINRTMAGELASVKRAAILKGEAGIGGRKRKDVAFDDAAKEFLAWATAEKKPKTAKLYGECLTPLKASFAGKRLSEPHPFLIEKHKRGRLEVMPNREVRAPRDLQPCGDARHLLRRQPRQGGEGRQGIGGPRPVPRAHGRGSPHGGAARAAPDAGARRHPCGLRVRAEALSLTWPNVDLRRNLVSVQAAFAKTGKTRSVTINSALRSALVGLKEAARSACVFTRRDGEPLRAVFMKACAKAKLEDVTPHVLRHTFGSRLAIAGVDLHTIRELGGWRSLKMVEGYAHLSPSHRAEAVERLASNFPMLFTTPAIGAVAPAAQVR